MEYNRISKYFFNFFLSQLFIFWVVSLAMSYAVIGFSYYLKTKNKKMLYNLIKSGIIMLFSIYLHTAGYVLTLLNLHLTERVVYFLSFYFVFSLLLYLILSTGFLLQKDWSVIGLMVISSVFAGFLSYYYILDNSIPYLEPSDMDFFFLIFYVPWIVFLVLVHHFAFKEFKNIWIKKTKRPISLYFLIHFFIFVISFLVLSAIYKFPWQAVKK